MKQTMISIFISVLTFVLCACSGDGITDTYWRDDKAGEWLQSIEDTLLQEKGYVDRRDSVFEAFRKPIK